MKGLATKLEAYFGPNKVHVDGPEFRRVKNMNDGKKEKVSSSSPLDFVSVRCDEEIFDVGKRGFFYREEQVKAAVRRYFPSGSFEDSSFTTDVGWSAQFSVVERNGLLLYKGHRVGVGGNAHYPEFFLRVVAGGQRDLVDEQRFAYYGFFTELHSRFTENAKQEQYKDSVS